MSKNLKIIIGGLIGIAIVGFGYYYLGTGAPVADQSISVDVVGGDGEVGKKLITTLEVIKEIKLDRSILENGVFSTLHDFSTPIAPQPVGRENPFAPL